jgi:hypothetical protein
MNSSFLGAKIWYVGDVAGESRYGRHSHTKSNACSTTPTRSPTLAVILNVIRDACDLRLFDDFDNACSSLILASGNLVPSCPNMERNACSNFSGDGSNIRSNKLYSEPSKNLKMGLGGQFGLLCLGADVMPKKQPQGIRSHTFHVFFPSFVRLFLLAGRGSGSLPSISYNR